MTGFVWVTVRGPDVTTGLAVPADLPLAEVLPDLARGAGLLDATSACAGHRVENDRGVVLRGDSPLREQGVGDGAVLRIRPGLRDPPRSAYDDVLPVVRPGRLGRLLRWLVRRRPGRSRPRAGGWPAAARRTPSGRGARAP